MKEIKLIKVKQYFNRTKIPDKKIEAVSFLERGFMPIVADGERTGLEYALRSCGLAMTCCLLTWGGYFGCDPNVIYPPYSVYFKNGNA